MALEELERQPSIHQEAPTGATDGACRAGFKFFFLQYFHFLIQIFLQIPHFNFFSFFFIFQILI